MATQNLLPARHDADGHERVVPGRVRLVHPDVRHGRDGEASSKLAQGLLVGDREHDGEGAGTQVPWARFTRGVHDLGALNSAREIVANDDVVDDGGGDGRRYVNRFSVGGCSWGPRIGSSAVMSRANGAGREDRTRLVQLVELVPSQRTSPAWCVGLELNQRCCGYQPRPGNTAQPTRIVPTPP